MARSKENPLILLCQIAEILKFESDWLRLNNAHCVGLKGSTIQKFVFFSFQTFRVGPYGALEHKITFPKAIIDTWKRKFFLSTVCNLIHFYQKLMIWSSAMFTNPTFHFFRSAHWSHLGWKKCKKKWIKGVEEIALKSVLKSLEQNAVQWLPIFNWAFLFLAHFQTNLGQCANQIV